ETVTDVKVEYENGSIAVYEFQAVVNKTGAELPSTGGIGTTIFYIAGSLLAIGAVILLITKRRMDANND
ncbi:MAG: LPXTG cell wall anchor domain-containing protein, partial [Clostridia bacterium]|nr:LPXTG cell wall anchor domain-containing protein [Clostridia bacterium]